MDAQPVILDTAEQVVRVTTDSATPDLPTAVWRLLPASSQCDQPWLASMWLWMPSGRGPDLDGIASTDWPGQCAAWPQILKELDQANVDLDLARSPSLADRR